MNLQTIQKRIEELQAELLTVSNDLAFLITGEVTRETVALIPQMPDVGTPWARDMSPGDKVICVGFTTSNAVRKRCFTVGKEYTVSRRLHGVVGDYNYGVRITLDDENEGHDATGVVFAKVGA